MILRNLAAVSILALILAACTSPSYVDKMDKKGDATANPFSKVVFHVYDTYNENPPECVAVMPLGTPKGTASKDAKITFDQASAVRRAVYAQLSPQGKRDVEIPRVDFVLKQMSKADRDNITQLGKKLNCDAVITGEVTEYGSSYFGIYSKVAVGADLKMVRVGNGRILWEASHVAESQGGSIPLSPVGLAMGIIDAATNVDEEHLLRVIDDLARRLVSTIPDNRIAVLEDPVERTPSIKEAVSDKTANNADDFLAALDGKPDNEQRSAITKAIKADRFNDQGTGKLYQALVAISPKDPEAPASYASYLIDKGDYDKALSMAKQSLGLDDTNAGVHFLKARVLIKMGNLDRADSAIIRAVALDNSNPDYFNGLGYVNSMRGNSERALAAYKMALARDPANGFAYYNTGVTLFNQGRLDDAADAFYGAGLSYLKDGNYGRTEKTVADLKELASQGLDLNDEIGTLEKALKRLTTGEVKNDKT